MHVVVTGGAGFIGSHLCDRLVKEGNEVVCVDNLFKGSKGNIAHLERNERFTFLEHDIVDPLPAHVSADAVYHLASPASPNEAKPKNIHAYPFETMLANTSGTWQLCEFALKHKAKFLFASTSEIYGEPLEHPQKETYRGNVSTTGLRSVYDEAKRFGETIVSAFVRSKGLDGRIVRIFNTYGPNMDPEDGRVIIEFLVCALKNEPIPVFGNGKQTRSFCYISDLVDGLIKAMHAPKTKSEIFNLGNPDEYTILDLAKKIKEITDSESEIVFSKRLPQDDPQRRRPDITKARTILHWQPKVSLSNGLKSTITYLEGKI